MDFSIRLRYRCDKLHQLWQTLAESFCGCSALPVVALISRFFGRNLLSEGLIDAGSKFRSCSGVQSSYFRLEPSFQPNCRYRQRTNDQNSLTAVSTGDRSSISALFVWRTRGMRRAYRPAAAAFSALVILAVYLFRRIGRKLDETRIGRKPEK